MPFLSSDSEHCELRFGANLLGGRSDGSVALAPLVSLPPTALILVKSDAGAVIRRLPSRVSIRVDGELLGSAPVELLDGSHLEVGEHRLIYNNSAENLATRSASPAAGMRSSAEHRAVDPGELSTWLLRELRTGRTIPVPKAGMLIGRSEDCHLVVNGRGVSRRHALLEPGAAGFAISDQSANGTLVNGIPCRPRQPLTRGDVVRIGEEDYRMENGGVINEATSESQRPTEVMPLVPVAVQEVRPEPLASLEVTRGRLRGTHYSIERPVCAIGSARNNDLRLADASVAPAHATLLLKADTWYVTDLRSPHGTFVNGYRVAGERALAPGSTLTIGHVTLVFRARQKAPEPEPVEHGGWLPRLFRFLAGQ
jgi:pSer/pThr/pTyr-binding forkhead associated (FHA) protein